MSGALDQPEIAKIVLAVMVAKLGGNVEVTQSDIDAVSYSTLEEWQSDDAIELRLVERAKSS